MQVDQEAGDPAQELDVEESSMACDSEEPRRLRGRRRERDATMDSGENSARRRKKKKKNKKSKKKSATKEKPMIRIVTVRNPQKDPEPKKEKKKKKSTSPVKTQKPIIKAAKFKPVEVPKEKEGEKIASQPGFDPDSSFEAIPDSQLFDHISSDSDEDRANALAQ